MATISIMGVGRLGSAAAAALRDAGDAGDDVRTVGRPAGAHDPRTFEGVDVAIDSSVPAAVAANATAALQGGVRRLVIATTGWDADRARVDALLREHGAAAVVAPNFSLGTALFARLVERAVELFGAVEAFDPYLLEWHRRGKADRPSGTANALARRIVETNPRLHDLEVVSVRAGASPGMHLVGFDAPGETVELRITARDRSAYAAGIVASARWLLAAPHTPGIPTFDEVVDDLLRPAALAAA